MRAVPGALSDAQAQAAAQADDLRWCTVVVLGVAFLSSTVLELFAVIGVAMVAVVMIPAPWIAAEMGWWVAECGRQPRTVDGVLPTAMSVSALSITEVALTLAGFVTFYLVLFVIEMGLMLKYIRKGPFQDVAETDAWVVCHTDRLAGRGHADAITPPDLMPAE